MLVQHECVPDGEAAAPIQKRTKSLGYRRHVPVACDSRLESQATGTCLLHGSNISVLNALLFNWLTQPCPSKLEMTYSEYTWLPD